MAGSPTGSLWMMTSAFGTASISARFVDDDVGVRHGLDQRALQPAADGMGLVEGLAAVELDVDLDEDPGAGGAGPQVVVALDPGKAGDDALDLRDEVGIGAAVHERVPGGKADLARAREQDRAGDERDHRIEPEDAEMRGGEERNHGAAGGQKVGQVVEAVGRDDLRAGPPRDVALPDHQRHRDRHGDPHHRHAGGLGGQRAGVREAEDRVPADGDRGSRDEHGLPEGHQILDRTVSEGVILVRGAGGIDDAEKARTRREQVERGIGE